MAIAAGIHVGRQGCWLLLVAVLLGDSTASGHKGHNEHCDYCKFKRISTHCNEHIGRTGIEAVGGIILDNQNLIVVLLCAGQMPTSRSMA
jgi:hypothetical protein